MPNKGWGVTWKDYLGPVWSKVYIGSERIGSGRLSKSLLNDRKTILFNFYRNQAQFLRLKAVSSFGNISIFDDRARSMPSDSKNDSVAQCPSFFQTQLESREPTNL